MTLRRSLRLSGWESHRADRVQVQWMTIVVYLASSMGLPAPSEWEMRLALGMGYDVVHRHLVDLQQLGVISDDLRVLPGWKEKVMA